MPRDTLRYGSLVIGIIAGIIAIPFFISVPFFGLYLVIFGGIIAGMIARGVIRGIAVSAAAGLILAALAIGIAAVNPQSFLNSFYQDVQFSSLLSSMVGTYLHDVTAFSITRLVELTMLYVVAIPVIGGFIGGALRPGY
ncbi:MAG: hypothetical protein M1267_05500 [Candidatus Thermoplasmatota archaeon]|jgi:hypothetical protein|nr:hypothetical protein [Candidatus Thermoplasmatota archaeon]MCL5799799.1 hypothetical protein [Candidatus Thermoplasmatota archaeon]